MTSWDYDRLKQKGYGRGSIIRCRMHNFLTYDEVEVFPGPKLNVLLGPNGTGKSAITHAICLACAGKPTLLGRSNQLAQFVKRGKEDDPTGAFVEIDILLNKGEIQNGFVATVRRTLSTESGASKYILNRRNSTEKEVKLLMASLSIDIANLCSFMPQDRVGKFAGYTPQEMLQNTLSSIACSKSLAGGALDDVVEDDQEGDSDVTNLYAVQMRLAEEEKNKISLESERAVKEQEVAKCQHEVDSLAPHVRAMETRQKLVEIRDFYQMKHSILQIQEADKERRKQQELVDAAEEQILAARQLIEPLVSRERDCRRMVAVREKEFAAVDTRYKRAVKVVGDARDKGLECETEIIDMQQQLMHLESEIEKVGGLLAQAKRDEATHRREFDEANHALQQQNVDAKLQILAEKLGGEYGEREREVADAIFELNNSRDELKERIDTLGRQLSRHTDPVKMWSNEVIKRATNDRSRTLYKSILQQMLYLRDNENQLRAEGKVSIAMGGVIVRSLNSGYICCFFVLCWVFAFLLSSCSFKVLSMARSASTARLPRRNVV
jgi:structural maintenance of chromosomes protein 5